MKKENKYLIQASCVIIFFALICGSNYCEDRECDNNPRNRYTIDVTVKNNSDLVITMYIHVDGFYDLMPNGGTHKSRLKEHRETTNDIKSYRLQVRAYLGPYIPGASEAVILGSKEVMITEFEESVNEKGELELYAQCIIEYPW